MKRSNYIFPSAKVRVLERYLMTEADMTRVIDAATPDVAFKAFNSLDYAGELLDLEAPQYSVAMDRKMGRLKKVLEKIVPDQLLLKLLFLERDYYNIKILLKQKISGQDYDEHLDSGPGLVRVDQLKRYIIDELEADVPQDYRDDIRKLLEEIGTDQDSEKIENLVDQRLNALNQEVARQIGNPFIIELYKYLADKNNLNLWLRARRLGKPKNWFAERVNDAGHIEPFTYLKYYDAADDGEFVQLLRNYFPTPISHAIDEYLKDKQIWQLELGVNNAIMEHLKKAKLVGSGPEVVVAYYFAKKYSIKNLKTIMALKFGGVEPAEIRQHLVASYAFN